MMDANSALVDDFLTRHTSPPAAGSNNNSNNNRGSAGQAPMIDSNSIKRIFQIQSQLTLLIHQAAQCIRELQTYNMFPQITDDEHGNQEVASIIVSILQQAEQPLPNTGYVPPQQQQQQQQPMNAFTNPSAGVVPTWESESKKSVNARGGGGGGAVDPFSAFGADNKTGGARNDVDAGFGAAAAGGTTKSGHNSGSRNKSNNANTSDLPIAFVEFKRSRYRKFLCDDPAIEPGSYVLVDGDRGTDCGLLVQMIHHLPDGQTSVVCMDGCDIKEDKVKLEPGRVIREATEAEVDRLHNTIAAAEAVALKTCRQRCQDLGIDIDLIDVEYQFDMKKIAFYFDCDHSVDFRTLVRELYRTFGARIWMENVHPKVKNSVPDAGGNGSDDEYNNHNGARKGRGGYGRGNGRGNGGYRF